MQEIPTPGAHCRVAMPPHVGLLPLCGQPWLQRHVRRGIMHGQGGTGSPAGRPSKHSVGWAVSPPFRLQALFREPPNAMGNGEGRSSLLEAREEGEGYNGAHFVVPGEGQTVSGAYKGANDVNATPTRGWAPLLGLSSWRHRRRRRPLAHSPSARIAGIRIVQTSSLLTLVWSACVMYYTQ